MMSQTIATMPSEPIPDAVRQDLDVLGIRLTNATETQMSQYLDLLLEANRRFNLTAIRDRAEAWRRHIIDSLTLMPWLENLPARSRIVDVGSGGGLPGIPLAVARPDIRVVLIEATGKKARFLQQCTQTLNLDNTQVVHGRSETLGQKPPYRQAYDVAVCRAVGNMRTLLEFTLPLIRLGGELLAMKGPSVLQEIDAASDAMAILGAGEVQVAEAYPAELGINHLVISIRKERPTPKEYPRLPGVPRHSPL